MAQLALPMLYLETGESCLMLYQHHPQMGPGTGEKSLPHLSCTPVSHRGLCPLHKEPLN